MIINNIWRKKNHSQGQPYGYVGWWKALKLFTHIHTHTLKWC